MLGWGVNGTAKAGRRNPPSKIPFPISHLGKSTHTGGPALCHSPWGRLPIRRERLLASTAPWLTRAFPFYTAATAPQRARPPEDAGRLQRDHAAT